MCGYLYFFAYGTPADLAGNLLLAQSNAISRSRTRAIHSKGKKTYCWTVNSRQTALNMVRQRVDGIITDRYDIVENVLDHMESRNDYERIMDVLLR
jgi:glycerophosphoryl diester phosphodiesterase